MQSLSSNDDDDEDFVSAVGDIEDILHDLTGGDIEEPDDKENFEKALNVVEQQETLEENKAEQLNTIFKSFIDECKSDSELLEILKTLAKSAIDLDSDITSIKSGETTEITLKNPLKLTGEFKTKTLGWSVTIPFSFELNKTISLKLEGNKLIFKEPIVLSTQLGFVELNEIRITTSQKKEVIINYSVKVRSFGSTSAGQFVKPEIKGLSITKKENLE